MRPDAGVIKLCKPVFRKKLMRFIMEPIFCSLDESHWLFTEYEFTEFYNIDAWEKLLS